MAAAAKEEKQMSERPHGAKIRAIIKRTDERYGHVTNISCTLKNLQNIVGGPIETVSVAGGAICIFNEEGKLRGLARNFQLGNWPYADIIVGDAVIVGADGEEFGDCPLDFQTWKKLLGDWGNM